MSRVQLALNVADLDEAIDFYSKLFATEPAKVRPGYANFAVDDPPLKLVLIEDATKVPGSLNHLGVEVENTDEVAAAQERLAVARTWPPPPRSRCRVATRSRTRCGSTAPEASRGRSTPCSRTPRCPPVSCGTRSERDRVLCHQA